MHRKSSNTEFPAQPVPAVKDVRRNLLCRAFLPASQQPAQPREDGQSGQLVFPGPEQIDLIFGEWMSEVL